jgi:hypothetical protein
MKICTLKKTVLVLSLFALSSALPSWADNQAPAATPPGQAKVWPAQPGVRDLSDLLPPTPTQRARGSSAPSAQNQAKQNSELRGVYQKLKLHHSTDVTSKQEEPAANDASKQAQPGDFDRDGTN